MKQATSTLVLVGYTGVPIDKQSKFTVLHYTKRPLYERNFKECKAAEDQLEQEREVRKKQKLR